MATGSGTILCIDRDISALIERSRFLTTSGYRVLTAANGNDGLRLFRIAGADAIVLGYYLGLMDGAAVAAVMKQIRPLVPIVMLSDGLDLPEGALEMVDALVTKSDGPRFLLATLQSVLPARPVPLGCGTGENSPSDDRGREPHRVLDELKAVIDSLPPQVKERVLTELGSFFAVSSPRDASLRSPHSPLRPRRRVIPPVATPATERTQEKKECQ